MSPCKMGISDKILTIGSCFADAIGMRLLSTKLSALSNPFGVVYNPYSIHKTIRYSIFNETPPSHTFLQRNDVFLNYDFHSEISSLHQEQLLSQLKEIIGATHYFLSHAQWLIITFGTAWVYERNDTGEIVANCHKVPQDLFSKSLLTQEKIIASFDTFYAELMKINSTIKIILTVSPVRHVKDTLELNSVSKAVLRTTCFTLIEGYPGVEYFPAYEIMMDDLRDYRFYKADMIHPTEVAEAYIWEKFSDRYFTADLKNFIEQWKDIQNALAHKPFQPSSNAHQWFLQETLKKLEGLKMIVNVDQEIASIKSQLFKPKL
jgi:hypothetical protein